MHSILVWGIAALFDFFLFPPYPPHSNDSPSICAEVLKHSFKALHPISSWVIPIQFCEEIRETKLAA
jgi:hypothetical protein